MILTLAGLEISVPEVIWTIISFIAFYFILKKVLYKPLLTNIYERRALIEEGRAAGVRAQTALEKERLQIEANLEKAQEQARNHVIDSRIGAERDRHFAMEAANRKAARLRKELEEHLSEEEAKGKAALESELPEFISILTNKMLGEEIVRADDALVTETVEAHKENQNK